MSDKDTTHFGYKQVDVGEKEKHVGEVFHSVAKKYDVMNDLMSLGIHRAWKHFAIQLTGVRPGHRILDLAGGTGDLAKMLAKKAGDQGEVYLTDINASMLEVGRDRMIDQGFVGNIHFVQGNAERLPFPDNFFDVVTIAFGLRNVTHKDVALKDMGRVLKPGGRLLVLEFSKPTDATFEKIYDFYSFSILPKIGGLVTDDEESYRYLAESIRMHPDQETLKQMMSDAGLVQCEYINMTGGIVAAHRGVKA